MKKKINSVLKKVLETAEPSESDLKAIDKYVKDFIKKVNQRIKSSKISAEVFVGGSYAKGTMIKKDKYDVDIFVRFNKKYKGENISELVLKILKDFDNIKRIHGSRDYFRININQSLFFEVIPVMKVNKSRNAENITDLSYYHVKYINKKIKSKKILKEIILAKIFCYANECYGAESYIKGFSGYALELLVYHYGSFLKFIKAMLKSKDEKIIIDIEKHYKRKGNILMDLNASKLESPIILIDPTYKQRNALATLSEETFNKFKSAAGDFLENPRKEIFEFKKKDFEDRKRNASRKKADFILLEAMTDKQEGDIAGSKLLKFYKHLISEIEKFYEIVDKDFYYNGKQGANYFFAVKKKGNILITGPKLEDKNNVKRFKQKHKNTFTKSRRIYAKKKVNNNLGEFIKNWKKNNEKRMKEMYITNLKIIS